MSIVRADKKIPAGILAILLGGLGIHKFYLGYTQAGVVTLVLYLIGWATSCIGVGALIIGALHLMGIVEGVIYLTKSDAQFYSEYQVGRRPWF